MALMRKILATLIVVESLHENMEQNSWSNFLDTHHEELVASLQLTDEVLEALLDNNIITRLEYDALGKTPPFFKRNMKYIELLRRDDRRIDFPKIINFFARHGDGRNKKAAALFQKFWGESKSGNFPKMDSEMAKPILPAPNEDDFRIPPDKLKLNLPSVDSADPATSTSLETASECKIHREMSLDTKVLYILALFSPEKVPRSWLDIFMKDEVCDGSIKNCLGAAMSRLEKSGPVRSYHIRWWIDDSSGAIESTLEELKSRCRQNDTFLRSFLFQVAEHMSSSKPHETWDALYSLLGNLADFASFGPVSKFLLHMHGTGLWPGVTAAFLKTFHREICRRPAGHELLMRKFDQYLELQKRLWPGGCSWYNFPPTPSSITIEWTMRSPELEQLMEPSDSAQIKIAVITGVAGSGKSTLAQLFASDYASRRMCRNVVWIDSSSTSLIIKGFKDLSVELCLSPLMDSDDPETTVFRLVENVYNQLLFSKTLLVFDDAVAFDGPNGIQPFLPRLLLRNAHSPLVIITSRDMNEWDRIPKDVFVRLRAPTTLETRLHVLRRHSAPSNPLQIHERLKYAQSFSWTFTALECAMEAIDGPDFAPAEDDRKLRSQIRSLPAFKSLHLKLQELFDRLQKFSHGSIAAEVLRFGAIVGCEVSVVFIWNTIAKDTGNMQSRRAFRGALNLLVSQSLVVIQEEKLNLDPGFRISLLAFMEQSPNVWLKSVQSVCQGLLKDGGAPNSEFLRYMRNALLEDNNEFQRTVATTISGMEQLSIGSEKQGHASLPIAEDLQILVATEPRSSSQGHSRSATTAEPYEVSLDREQWIKFLEDNQDTLVQTIRLDDCLLRTLQSKGILGISQFEKLESINVYRNNDRAREFIEMLQDGFTSTDKLKAMIEVLGNRLHRSRAAARLLKRFVEDSQLKGTSNKKKL